jgi:hypothetical protein
VKTTGGATVCVNASQIASFGFVVQRDGTDPIKGSLTVTSPSAGIKLKAVTFTSLVVTTTTADFGGTCTNNKTPCTFSVHAEDNGEAGTTDVFRISINGGPPLGGTLRSGNIQIH